MHVEIHTGPPTTCATSGTSYSQPASIPLHSSIRPTRKELPELAGAAGRGQNWDPTSALRLRVRSWTAFFAETAFVFWNTSWAKDYQSISASVYLGPQEGRYVRILQTYTQGFDPRRRVVPAHLVPVAAARGYALRGPSDYGLYVVAAGDDTAPTSRVTATVDLARAGTATWIDPATGRVLATKRVRGGAQALSVPSFVTDIALKIASGPS